MWPSIFFATASEGQRGTRGYKKDYNRFLLASAELYSVALALLNKTDP
jgi:hypothetical protein